MNILHIDCSPRDESHSRQLSSAVVARLRGKNAGIDVTYRDLGRHPIPHTGAEYAIALSSPATLAEGPRNSAFQLSEQLIREVEAAEVLVIGTPMNNFTVPSVLKAWIDQILRIGRTFSSSSEGKVGLLRDRPVFICVASGGVFAGDRANQPDFLTPYMKVALGCVGLMELYFLPLQATAFLDQEQLATARDSLIAKVDLDEILFNLT
ncbi:NAD(P)H-dependent oxidoreductase [Thalassospira sp. NFXS8]|uniref:FMN-dependent NADH-azoreductase n=1 Tax=Thalassospira sp. NFXS8 TaxID=2819093 RepID=UPI0032DE9ED2